MSADVNHPVKDEFRELVEAYAIGALEGQERAALEAHLAAGCAACAQALAESRWTVSQLAYLAPEAQPPDLLRGRLLQTVRAEASVARKGAAAKSAAPMWLWAGVAALLIFSLYNALNARRLTEQIRAAKEHEAQSMAQNQTLAAELETAKREAIILTDPASVRIAAADKAAPAMAALWHAKLGILVTGQNVPALEAKKTLQLWLIPKAPGGKPIPSLALRPDAEGKFNLLVANPPESMTNTKALAITVEPEGGSAAPTSAPIWVGPVA